MVQKYLPARSLGEAQVSRSSSLVSLRSHTSSQLQCRGFPPKLSTSAVRGEPFILAYTGIRRNSGSGGIFLSLLDVMSSLVMETEGNTQVRKNTVDTLHHYVSGSVGVNLRGATD